MTSTVDRLYREVGDQFDWDGWDGNVACTPQWLGAHRRTGRGLLAVRGAGGLLAVLERKAPGALGPVGRYHGGFAPLPGAGAEDVLDALAVVARYSWVGLPHSPHWLHTHAGRLHPRRVVSREHDHVFTVGALGVDQYDVSRPRKLRATIRRAQAAADASDQTVRPLAPGGLTAVLDRLVAVERAGHRTKGHVLASRAVSDALVDLDADGRLVVHVLQRGVEPLGYLVAGRGATQDHLYTTAIRAELADSSAGSLLFAAAIRNALASGRAVSMGAGATAFKRRFATASVPQADAVLLPAWAGAAERPLARALGRVSSSGWS